MDVIPLTSYLNHNAFSLDYFPALRSMARSENVRAENNEKRSNRFFNYLQSLGVKLSEPVLNTACHKFNVEKKL